MDRSGDGPNAAERFPMFHETTRSVIATRLRFGDYPCRTTV